MVLQSEQAQQVELTIGTRNEPRELASGDVTLTFDSETSAIHGEMVDVSRSGFRIRYCGNPLPDGSQVTVCYPWGKVRASVVWKSVQENRVEVGFLITA